MKNKTCKSKMKFQSKKMPFYKVVRNNPPCPFTGKKSLESKKKKKNH